MKNILPDIDKELIDLNQWQMTRQTILFALCTKTEKTQLEILNILKTNPKIEMRKLIEIIKRKK